MPIIYYRVTDIQEKSKVLTVTNIATNIIATILIIRSVLKRNKGLKKAPSQLNRCEYNEFKRCEYDEFKRRRKQK